MQADPGETSVPDSGTAVRLPGRHYDRWGSRTRRHPPPQWRCSPPPTPPTSVTLNWTTQSLGARWHTGSSRSSPASGSPSTGSTSTAETGSSVGTPWSSSWQLWLWRSTVPRGGGHSILTASFAFLLFYAWSWRQAEDKLCLGQCNDAHIIIGLTVIMTIPLPRLWPLHYLLWLAAVTGVSMLLLARGHYTVDVVIAYFITTRLWYVFL